MKREYILILPVIILTLFLPSCGNRDDSDVSKAFDSLKHTLVSDSVNAADTAKFENTISSFSGTYNAVTDWSKFGKGDLKAFRKSALNKYIVVPLMKEQINGIREDGFTDTTLVFTGEKDNAFVFLIGKGEKNTGGLSPEKNALLLLKVTEITASQKLYLVKKHTDFQHREMRVTEFTVSADLIDAAETDASAAVLGRKFAAQW